jgi:hypothetical protein
MLFPLNVCPSSLSVIVSYLGSPVMFTVTRSFRSVVVALTPRSTVPPLPATHSVLSATVRTGFVTDDVGGGVVLGGMEVVGSVGVVVAGGVVDVGGVIGEVDVGGDVGVVGEVGVELVTGAYDPVDIVKFRKSAATVSEFADR